MKVDRKTEQKNRGVMLPGESSMWDRFWYMIIRVLAATQALILEKVIDERCWRSDNGTITRYCDLGPRHLDNIINMLRRRGNDSPEYRALVREAHGEARVPCPRRAGTGHAEKLL